VTAPDQAITNAELARRMEHLGSDLHDDLREIKAVIDKLVPREVYQAERIAADQRVEALQSRVAALESRGRWLIGVVIIPIVIVVLGWLLTAKGVKS
jgi:hypothetical protein